MLSLRRAGWLKPLLEKHEAIYAAEARGLVFAGERAFCAVSNSLQEVFEDLSEGFSEPLMLLDVRSGELLRSDCQGLGCDLYGRIEVLGEVCRRGVPEIVEEVAPFSMLAIPLQNLGVGENLVAVGVFVNQQVDQENEVEAAARAFGVDVTRALRWCEGKTPWPSSVLLSMAKTVLENLLYRQQVLQLQSELGEASAYAGDVCSELDLLHRLTGQLHLSDSEQNLWQGALQWLAESVPAQSLCIVLHGAEGEATCDESLEWKLIAEGELPVREEELFELVRRFGQDSLRRPILLNRTETALPTWHCPTVRELACVPIEGSDQPSGWLLALNHKGDSKAGFSNFGSMEIRLLSSVGTILGIHNSNLGLYQDQSNLFSSAVQALTSAIDAKDGYTSGHSNRVAYFSVALAEQLGLSRAEQDTIYLAGLLHDIGKIGINDRVLNKPGKLTEEEFEQIKLHPQLGYDILSGVRQLGDVLPIVLHHHEDWDGGGYPHGLAGAEIPRMARIVAVADAFDAMSSDRPYRRGLSDDKIDEILRDGSGTQWDAEVVEAFFEIREEIRRIVQVSACQASLEYADSLN